MCRNKELVKHHYNLSETNGQSVYARLYKQHHRCEVSQEYLGFGYRHAAPEGVAIVFAPPAEVKKDLLCLPVMG